MKGEVKYLEGSDGRLLDRINQAFGINALRKATRYGLYDGLSNPGEGDGGYSDTAPKLAPLRSQLLIKWALKSIPQTIQLVGT
jgi:hypothetical protein